MRTVGRLLGDQSMSHANVRLGARMRPTLSVTCLIAAALSIGGCSESLPSLPKMTELNPFAEKQKPLPGVRVPVIADTTSA